MLIPSPSSVCFEKMQIFIVVVTQLTTLTLTVSHNPSLLGNASWLSWNFLCCLTQWFVCMYVYTRAFACYKTLRSNEKRNL
jgi:hypothetical protein